MKTLRNALTALLTALLILGTLPFTALAADNTAGAPLQFKNGKFKILILSDIQDTNTPQQATVDLMNNAIDQTKPDFIALTGDNIAGWWKGVTPEETKAYLAQLAQMVPSVRNLEAYTNILQSKYHLRALITTSRDIIEQAEAPTAQPEGLLEYAEQRIYDIRNGHNNDSLIPVSRVVLETFDHLQRLSGENRADYLGISTGYGDLDRTITGLNKSDLILVAARPGMGKTAFALNIAANVALRGKKTVAIFSLEMSREQLMNRLFASEGGIDSRRLLTGELSTEDWGKVADLSPLFGAAPLYMDDTAGITVAEMKAKLRRVRNLGLVVIDYLQLMSTGRRSDNRVQEVSEITRSLKIMAKELNVPVITLSQLSRGPESRSDHRPMLSDLRESGSIEQDADIVLFLYREAYYEKDRDDQSEAECIVAKNRHGETGSINLRWDGRYTRFFSVDRNRE